MSSHEIDRLVVRPLEIPFKVSFRHAAAERAETSSVWVEAHAADGTVGRGESCPRPYVTGETLESAMAFVVAHEADVRRHILDVNTLRAWVSSQRLEIDTSPAAWCAIELAILDLLGKQHRVTVEQLLGMPSLAGPFRYTAVLGDAEPDVFQSMAAQYRRLGFRDYKIKLSGDLDRDRAKMRAFEFWPRESVRLRADANNLWADVDAAIGLLSALGVPFFAIEEPIVKERYDQLPRLAAALDCRIILDESLRHPDQLRQLPPPASQWIANIRVSKMGGLIRSLDAAAAAAALGVGIIVGAQVGETSLLTRAALTVAHAARGSLVAQEGALGTRLLERDICDPPLMFGAGGVLEAGDYPRLQTPGLGVTE
jgi:L-Ala-D/L-Glu epimerase